MSRPTVPSLHDKPIPTEAPSINETSSCDTEIISSPQSYCQLQKLCQTDGTVLSPNAKPKSIISEAKASKTSKFNAYPSNADLDDVAAALVSLAPMLQKKTL
ncbi:hypothetical protein QQF64_023775 [Cirrhinus molitorella]|uniref:Uncharacterized protein n=1 Tax=Cirrhinus molitorella TaxID=172907 RepID=A0ABR3NJT5_9TELE